MKAIMKYVLMSMGKILGVSIQQRKWVKLQKVFLVKGSEYTFTFVPDSASRF